ncbi:DUF305 domain-containing protein [Modestobacter muralis]|uniref:DUF305 domain-containing protein n=1 Tax=Modestobacter muralis TaxID=1608614 RepID=A0A6P0HA48_9ACTN|nr:DUF305 domain-containing protein [Modestobacter muralis]NEK95724.1 DUF305 domain-containing protein [Modestobacter muralis]NEN52612.1 DUF305 domain-containing protein [Modestobacter muralis]
MTQPTAPPARRALTAVLVAVIAVGLLVAGGGLAVAAGIGRSDTPAADSVDAGFSRDMSRHHLQAVEMADMALTHSSDDEVRRLAFDISATQTNQAGRMQGWLALWGLPATSGEVMGWMDDGAMSGHVMGGMSGHDVDPAAAADGAVMPGMATETELTELRGESGPAFDVLFLQLMTRHHQGGLEMAEYGEDHASEPAVASLARSIAQSQTAETTTMEQMLRARGGVPLPAP